jgi:hypothetical protein
LIIGCKGKKYFWKFQIFSRKLARFVNVYGEQSYEDIANLKRKKDEKQINDM